MDQKSQSSGALPKSDSDAFSTTTTLTDYYKIQQPLHPQGWGAAASPPDPELLSKARANWREAEERGEDPYKEYKELIAATEPSSSGIERIYRWAEKKVHHKDSHQKN